ncbi:hypothetical protein GCM10009544_02110 [Streptomyces stramineus]|uniref:Uncharacterized protein n=1 Tax=Streptomyces stramineus TaxID=173861 RepID=A0ABN0ZBZ1_9ACTN
MLHVTCGIDWDEAQGRAEGGRGHGDSELAQHRDAVGVEPFLGQPRGRPARGLQEQDAVAGAGVGECGGAAGRARTDDRDVAGGLIGGHRFLRR